MSLSGARGLVRVSKNPACEWQAAMAIERVREPDFYQHVTGRTYRREYGERAAARSRGAKFEANLHQNNAALLRRAMAPLYGLDPEAMVVRNFAEEVPGPPSTMRAVRLHRTRRVLRDLAAEKPVPHLLIQPQLRLPTGHGAHDFEFISPDCMVLDSRIGIYVPAEEKSFIVRDHVADAADLDSTRRQAAVQILALRAETASLGIDGRVADRAAFVFATPYGLSPAPAFEERLDAEVHEMVRAVVIVGRVRARLAELRALDNATLPNLLTELKANPQEACFGSCVFADLCHMELAGKPTELGDDAVDLVGADADLDRLAALALGAEPTTPREAELAASLSAAAEAIGWRAA